VTLSGRYGPSVEFSASAGGSHSRSKDESTSSSVSFAQEITERSAKKITERVLKRESLRVTTELTEKNSHILNNVQSGSTNISGVYQWVNKVYQAQVFNYGLRTMFDFMIPEPAAFLLEALRSSKSSQMEIYKPPEFVLKPNEIEEDKIGDYINLYGATDITPPPEEYKTISTEFKASGSKHDYNQAAQIAIDDGYEAVNGCVTAILTKHYDPPIIDFALGRRLYRGFDEAYWTWVTDLDNETKSIPFAFDTWHVGMVAVAVEIKCHRTEHLMDKWRYETHAKLTIAYKARLSEYEEKLNALNIQSGIAIQGKNPNFNLEIMNNELKKNCISIITDQHYVLFNAIEPGSNGFPQINVNEAAAEGSYVRFFEQAFEWENMTWISYPYFWGRKSQWLERIDFEDPDPLFNEFLKAGYCRVVVPARPGFESAIDHFMKYGQTWNGGPLPTISDPLYIPLADEMSQRLDRPGDEVPVGDPWIVKIPTTLIRLRPDESLPKWVFDENGNWIEG
jgi:hypothetical protein